MKEVKQLIKRKRNYSKLKFGYLILTNILSPPSIYLLEYMLKVILQIEAHSKN